MKILIVEDDIEYAENIEKKLKALGRVELTFAKSRDSAIHIIKNNFFDLVVLDLKIPTVDGALDEEPVHGNAVFEVIRQDKPGTPIFVLTGSPAEPFVEKLVNNVHQADIWGSGNMPTVKFHVKHKFGEFPDEIGPYVNAFSSIFNVELKKPAEGLSEEEDRILRIFSTQVKARRCVVKVLGGGLSGARVFGARLTNSQGALVYEAVTKIGPRKDVYDESDRFDMHVSRLEGKATPRKLALVEFGAGAVCGVFYSLASGYETDAFAISQIDSDASQNIVGELEKLTAPWRKDVPQSSLQIQRIRERAINDEKFFALRKLIPFQWIEEFEQKEVQIVNACNHGDMHGLNVLATADGLPILIDYGDVGESTASWDPITLELSLFFHAKGPLKDSQWPTREQAEQWGNLDIYLQNCPIPRFVQAARAWATKCAAGDREIAATAYSYLVRQLKYEDTNKDRAYALLTGAKALYDNS